MNATLRATAVLGIAVLLAGVSTARAQESGDTASVDLAVLRIGERSTLSLRVRAPAGATVEVDPGAASWNGVEVVSIFPAPPEPAGGEALYRFRVIVAPFLPGEGSFQPSVTVITPEGASVRLLPAVSWTVLATVGPEDSLELRPLPPPASIAGAESPLLRPAIALGAVLAVAAVIAVATLGARWVARHRPAPGPALEPVPGPASFEAVESLLDHDPVSAYRSLAAMVRSVVGDRYSVPATALTTSELRARMESSGADRFQARLVGGFLEECDSVVYAGYRPAAERRRADLTMAREIVEAW